MNWAYLPLTPLWMLIGIIGGLLLIRIIMFRKEHARLRPRVIMLLMRTCVLAIVGLMLLNPTSIMPREQDDKPQLLVLVDTSRSMAVSDVDARTRLQAATDTLATALPQWDHSLRVLVRRFDTEASLADPSRLGELSASGTETALPQAIRSAVAELSKTTSESGILILSDGQSTQPGASSAAEYALSQSVPIWTTPLGGSVPQKDIRLEVDNHEVIAFAGESVAIRATLHQEGYPNRLFKVSLLANRTTQETLEVQPGEDGAASMTFHVTAPEKGEERLSLQAAPLEDESDAVNNEQSVFLRVIAGKPRILVAEGQPHWDTKFLVQSLNANPHLEVTAVYRVAPKRHVTITSGADGTARKAVDSFPRTEDDYSHYDMIILGRCAETFFDENTDPLLTAWVARGGRLVFARGKPYATRCVALSKFEPVIWAEGAEQAASLVPAATASPCPVFQMDDDISVMLASLPRFDLVASTQGSKSLSTIWATSDTQHNIILATSRYGLGQTLTFNAGGFWRWAFHEKKADQDEEAYDRFWNILIRWMLSEGDFPDGSDISFASERRVVADNVPLRFLMRARGNRRDAVKPEMQVFSDQSNEASSTLNPTRLSDGVWTAQAGPFPVGHYAVELHTGIAEEVVRRIEIDVISSSRENHNLSADPATMQSIAKITQANTLPLNEIPQLSSIMDDWHAARRIANERQSLWDRWWLMGGVFLLLGVEWLLRRREGLL